MEKYTPARKISNRHGLGKVTGLFFSDKMNMHIAWESQLERDYCYLLDFDKKIKRFFSQPKTFNFTYSGRKIRYTPDFYIEYIDGSSEYIEIKFSNVLENLKIARKLKILKNYFSQNGIQYKILFEDDIRKQPRLRNIKFLKKYCKIVYIPKDPLEFYGKLKDLRQYIDDQYIYSAMYKGLIKFDIEKGSRYYLRNLLALNQNIIRSDESFIGIIPPSDVLPSLERTVPDNTLALVVDAINNKKAIRVSYLSMTSDVASERTLNPHAMVFDGHRWHVRAFCQTRKNFRDFVLARILTAETLDEAVVSSEQDIAWHTYITLVFKPSSDLSETHRKAIEFDYGMIEGKIEIKCRKALLFYTLKRYNLLKDFITDNEKLNKLNDQFISLSNYEDISPFIKDEIGQ